MFERKCKECDDKIFFEDAPESGSELICYACEIVLLKSKLKAQQELIDRLEKENKIMKDSFVRIRRICF